VKLIDTGNLANEIQNQDKPQDKFVSIIQQPEDKDNLNDEITTVEQIREELKNFWRQSMRDMFIEHLQTKQEIQKQVVHEQHACDGCGMNPIVGIRYKCSVKADYDLCENCEARGVNAENTMLKIRTPEQAPHKLICQYGNGMLKSVASAMSNADLLSQIGNFSMGNMMPKEPKRFQQGEKFMARFVRESIPDKQQIVAGETFSKSWTFRNSGEIAWPEDVIFCQSSGDDMMASVDMVRCKVQPGAEWTFTVSFKAPVMPGKYTSFFRIQTGNIKFGHKAWCDIMVVEKDQEVQDAKMADDQKLEEVKPVSAAAAEPENLALSSIQIDKDMKTPKQIYMDKTESKQAAGHSEDLVALYDLGFVCFDTNLALMKKY
jgi:hypothetical protein